MYSSLNVANYYAAGFVKVCDVCAKNSSRTRWFYKNINKESMFSTHRSWVYFIVVDGEIVKVGETGNPLGIEKKFLYELASDNEEQPMAGTKSRLGRLAWADGEFDTDANIKWHLYESVKQNKVSIWAKKCEIVSVASIDVAGEQIEITSHFHKDLETKIIDYIANQTGYYPKLNKARK